MANIKFEKIINDYGYLEGYKVPNTDIKIIKSQRRVKTTNVGFSTLERYAWESCWDIHGLKFASGTPYFAQRRYLKDAKACVIEYLNN